MWLAIFKPWEKVLDNFDRVRSLTTTSSLSNRSRIDFKKANFGFDEIFKLTFTRTNNCMICHNSNKQNNMGECAHARAQQWRVGSRRDKSDAGYAGADAVLLCLVQPTRLTLCCVCAGFIHSPAYTSNKIFIMIHVLGSNKFQNKRDPWDDLWYKIRFL